MDEVKLVWGAVVEGVATGHEMRLALWFLGLAESLAWHEQAVLQGVSFSRKDGHWAMVVRVRLARGNGAGKPVVAFHYGDDPAECISSFANAVAKRTVEWKDDRYATT